VKRCGSRRGAGCPAGSVSNRSMRAYRARAAICAAESAAAVSRETPHGGVGEGPRPAPTNRPALGPFHVKREVVAAGSARRVRARVRSGAARNRTSDLAGPFHVKRLRCQHGRGRRRMGRRDAYGERAQPTLRGALWVERPFHVKRSQAPTPAERWLPGLARKSGQPCAAGARRTSDRAIVSGETRAGAGAGGVGGGCDARTLTANVRSRRCEPHFGSGRAFHVKRGQAQAQARAGSAADVTPGR
jgi:hypothetical protein